MFLFIFVKIKQLFTKLNQILLKLNQDFQKKNRIIQIDCIVQDLWVKLSDLNLI